MFFNSRYFLAFEQRNACLRIALFETKNGILSLCETRSISLNKVDSIDWQSIKKQYKKYRAMLCISKQHIMQKEIYLDSSLSQKEIGSVLRQSTEQHFAQPYSRLYLDYEPVAPLSKDNKQCLRISAISHQHIQPLLISAKKAGFKFQCLDVDVFCAARCLQRLHQPVKSALLAIFEQDSLSLMHVYQNDIVFLKSSAACDEQDILKLMQYCKTNPYYEPSVEVYYCGGLAQQHTKTLTTLCHQAPILLTPERVGIKAKTAIGHESSWVSACGLALRSKHD